MAALSTFYLGRIYSTRNYLLKDGQFLDYVIQSDHRNTQHHLWDDDLFLYYICYALLSNYNGKYEEAMEYYDKAEFYMNRSRGNYFFAYPHFCMAKQETLHNLGREEERMELLLKYRKFCKENYYLRHLQSVNRFLDGEENVTPEPCILSCPTMDKVCEAERMRSVERDAKARRKEIQFFSLFQNLLDKNEDDINQKMNDILSAE